MPRSLHNVRTPEAVWPYQTFGQMLRFWRTTCGLSQEELADSARMSVRHLSFLENGKTRPSVIAVRRLAEIIGLGPREHDTLLVAAGHAPAGVAGALARSPWYTEDWPLILKAADPVPTSFMAPSGDILAVNRAWLVLHRHFLGGLVDEGMMNALDLLLHPTGWRAHLANWRDVASVMLTIVMQTALLGTDLDTLAHIDNWVHTSGLPDDWAMTGVQLSGENMNYSFPLALEGGTPSVARVVHSSLGYYPGKRGDTVIQQAIYPIGDAVTAMLAHAVSSCASHPSCPY